MDESSNEYDKIMSYVDAHPTAVVSTTNADGTPHAATVYLVTASHHTVCFITRNLTKKYQNIFDRPDVSVTIYDERESSTLQANGKAFVANNESMLDYVLEKISKIHAERAEWEPPIQKLRESGDYVVIGIELSNARLAEYQGLDVAGKDFFTEYKPD